MAKTGRPKIEIDYNLLDNLCEIQCTGEEIAQVLGISYDTIVRDIKSKYNKSFAEYFEQKRGTGKISLRRKQMEVALSGDRTLLIWLGKQYLGQADKQEIGGKDGSDINIQVRIKEFDDD